MALSVGNIRETLRAALVEDETPELPDLREDPARQILDDIQADQAVQCFNNRDLVRLFNIYCRNFEGEMAGVRTAIADEMCSRVDPMWADRGPRSIDQSA